MKKINDIKKTSYALLFMILIGCTSYTENTGFNQSQEELANKFEEEVLPGYLEAVNAGAASETVQLPFEERQRIANEQGISEDDAKNFQKELRLFAEDIGFEERDLEFIETPYFFVDGAGEIRDMETYKGLLSYIMQHRITFEEKEKQINDLFHEYLPRIEAAKGDTAEARRLFEEYDKKRANILNDIADSK